MSNVFTTREGITLEADVVSKFEELESQIDTLEREVRRLSISKPCPPSLPSIIRTVEICLARREAQHTAKEVSMCYGLIVVV